MSIYTYNYERCPLFALQLWDFVFFEDLLPVRDQLHGRIASAGSFESFLIALSSRGDCLGSRRASPGVFRPRFASFSSG